MSGLESAARQHWRPGARVARLHSSHSYRSVLGLIFAVFLFVAAAPSSSWAPTVLTLGLCALMLLALWTSGLSSDYRLGIVFAAVSIAVAIAALIQGGSTLTGAVGVFDFVLALGATVTIGVGVVDQGEVNRQSVLGAICIYVLIGLLFTFVYGAAAALGSGSFFAQGTDGTPDIRLYFSYVTLATLGYGDYTPSGNFGRTLAILEALLGQLYLVTVLALLVSNLGHKRAEPPEA
jgi:hypothetical protein